MKRTSPISRLLRLREIREEQARAAFGAATQASEQARAHLAEAEVAYQDRPGMPGVLSPAALRGLWLQGVRSHELVAAAGEAYQASLVHAGEARSAWSSASSDLRSVEKLDQRRRADAEHLAQTAADRALDELVIILRSVER